MGAHGAQPAALLARVESAGEQAARIRVQAPRVRQSHLGIKPQRNCCRQALESVAEAPTFAAFGVDLQRQAVTIGEGVEPEARLRGGNQVWGERHRDLPISEAEEAKRHCRIKPRAVTRRLALKAPMGSCVGVYTSFKRRKHLDVRAQYLRHTPDQNDLFFE